MHIHFLQNKEIDKARWDDVIRNSSNGLIYGWSIYLDHLCPGWSALVNDDYSLLMPLTHRKKFGITYLYQPPFCQQLGIFGTAVITETVVADFITACKKHFSFGEIFINHANGGSGQESVAACKNYILRLQNGYDDIKKDYTVSLQKNSLNRIKKFDLQYVLGNDVEKVINFSKQLYGQRVPHVTDNDYETFIKLCVQLYNMGYAFTREVKLPDGELLASGVFLKDEKRIYNLISATPPNGRIFEANHLLFDRLIQEFAGTGLVLDFEGSDIPGIAHFYRKFGAINEPYYFLKWNELPWPARLVKK
ncbi:MAG: hypothetical protein V4722_26095 [Bacteroidota bacterium]